MGVRNRVNKLESSDPILVQRPTGPSLMDLPTELHLLISSNLIYPDALSLKHTNQHFNKLVNTGVKLKVEWLIERRRLHLDCPHGKNCELGSDMRFCRGSVRLLMKRRREHGECESHVGGRGCLVLGTPICTLRKKHRGFQATSRRWARKLFVDTTVFLWILLTIAGLTLAWGWVEMRKLEKGIQL